MIINMLIGVFCLYLLLLIFDGKIYGNIPKLISYNIYTITSYITEKNAILLYQIYISKNGKYLTIYCVQYFFFQNY